jgi:enoyl-CoA hydratase/carnithine racemase
MSLVLTAHDAGVFRVQMNRPEKKNAITRAMYAALADALLQAADDPAVRVLLVTGAPGLFTAGNDLGDFLDDPPRDESAPVFRFLRGISTFEKPIVAAVAGAAVGIGTTMLLHCDFVYAAEDARFSLPFVNLGLCPEAASSLLLPLVAGYHRAAELLLLGEPFDARRAEACDIVTQVVPAERLEETALATARKLAALPPAALRVSKALMKRSLAPRVADAMTAERDAFSARLRSPEAKEAFNAFFGRRKPDFSRF